MNWSLKIRKDQGVYLGTYEGTLVGYTVLSRKVDFKVIDESNQIQTGTFHVGDISVGVVGNDVVIDAHFSFEAVNDLISIYTFTSIDQSVRPSGTSFLEAILVGCAGEPIDGMGGIKNDITLEIVYDICNRDPVLINVTRVVD